MHQPRTPGGCRAEAGLGVLQALSVGASDSSILPFARRRQRWGVPLPGQLVGLKRLVPGSERVQESCGPRFFSGELCVQDPSGTVRG